MVWPTRWFITTSYHLLLLSLLELDKGCLLSPIIFTLFVDWALNHTMDQPRCLQSTFAKTLYDLNCVDDIGLLSHYFKHIQEKSRHLSTVALQIGLEINTRKTRSMRVNTATTTLIQKHYQQDRRHWGGHQIQDWKSSTCLCHSEASLEQPEHPR